MPDPQPSTDARPVSNEDADRAHELEVLRVKHKIPAETIDQLKAKYPSIWMLVDAPIIFKEMSGDQFERVMAQPDKQRIPALKQLASFIVVYPPPAEYEKLVQRWPLIYTTITEAAVSIASNKYTGEAKKL